MPRKAWTPTWQDAAIALHSLDPKKWNTAAIGRLFGKNTATVWWALHPGWRREFDRERYRNKPGRKEACKASAKRCHQRKRATRRWEEQQPMGAP